MIRTIAITFDDRRVVTRAIDAGLKLTDLATGLYSALEALREAERDIDGYPLSDGLPRGQSEDTSVERALDHRYNVIGEREQMRDDLAAIISMIDSMAYVVGSCLERYTAPAKAQATCDGKGLQGWEIKYTPYSVDPANGWFLEDCGKPIHRAKLCVGCYQRARRWRNDHELPELNDDREVAA